MRFLTIKALEPLVIRDKSGAIVYKCTAGKVFTLPIITKFYVKGRFEILEKPKKYKLVLPFYPKEKNVKFLGIKKILFRQNPNKLSIDVFSGLLIIDKDFWDGLNIVQKLFVIFHEIGHYFYYTEYKCDTFATALLLGLGFTPSQINSAVFSTLEFSEYRKKRNLAILKKNEQ